MTTLLAIDTAAPRLQLALLTAGGDVDTSIDDIAQGHAEILFDRIGMLLERHGLAYDRLTRIAVTTGPGSFTGLRIGLSAARGLGLARSIPVLGIPTLLALSLAAPEAGPVSVLVDARRDEAYFQRFSAPGQPIGAARLLPMAEARTAVVSGDRLLETPFVDIARLARFAASADPGQFPAEAAYIRSADAKPQLKGRVAHQEAGS